MNATVSILMPAYNAATFIEETLDSVVSQTHPTDELIIVDDGSTDNTYQVIENWVSKQHLHFPVKVVRQQNQGASVARNTAIENATKDYVAFLDADDLLLPEHLDLLLSGVELCPECVIIFADQQVFTENVIISDSFLCNKPVVKLPFERLGDFRVISCSLWATLIIGNYIPTSASLVKRLAAIQVGGFDPLLTTSEDRHFLLKLSRIGRVGYFDKVIARKREHEANLTHEKNNFTVAKNGVEVIKKILKDTSLYHLTPEELRKTENALEVAIENYAYVASKDSFAIFWITWLDLFKAGHYKYLFNLKNIIRTFRHLF